MIFNDEEREAVVDWLTDQITRAGEEQSGRRKKWETWRRQREALPEFPIKHFPGSDRPASNVVPPISMSNTNTTYAALHNTFGKITPFWTITAFRDKDQSDVEVAKFLTRYMDILDRSKNDLDRRRRAKTVHYETGSLGTCIVKVPWTKHSWYVTEDVEGGPRDVEVNLHEGPEICPIPAEDFLKREAYQDIPTAPMVAHLLHHTWPEIEQLGEQGFYEGVDDLEKWSRTSATEQEAAAQAREGVSQGLSDIWDLYECYFFWEVGGRWRDCVATLEVNSGLLLREGYNELGWRPFVDFAYLLRPHRLEGIGVGHMTEHMQEEGTMLHNTRNDSLHASVFGMFTTRRSAGARQNEPLYPAKIWVLDDPSKDLGVVKLPEPSSASLLAENQALMYAQKATGMGDAMGGFADATVKTRDSSGLMAQRIRQSTGVFGAISEGIEDSWGMVGYMVFLQLVHHREEVLAMEGRLQRLTANDLALLEKGLSIPKNEIPLRLRFSVRTSDVEQSFETKRQNLLTRTQLSAMFFQQVTPIVQMVFGPQGQQMRQQAPDMWAYLARMYTSRCRMMEEAIKFFGEDDTGRYVPDYERLEALLDFQRTLTDTMSQMKGVPDGQGQGGQGDLNGLPPTATALPIPTGALGGGPGGAPGTAGPGGATGTSAVAPRTAGEPGLGSF